MIIIEKLTKVYGEIRAVDDLNLEVYPGEIFGFLGPNGAGKTTTIRILTTLTKPVSGRVWVNGFDVITQPLQAKGEFGVVQQHLSLDRELTVWESMELHARLHHIGRVERRRRIAELIDYVELAPQAHEKVENLSGGMKRRLMIARALIHRPKLLFLDEPTVGLDPQTRRRLWELIRRMNLDGATIFLTTHYIEEAEALCHRVGIIHQGRLIALGSPQELRQQVGMVTVETLSDDKDVNYHYFPDRSAAAAYAQSLPHEVKTITMRDSNLEDVFVELTGRKVGNDYGKAIAG
ncbi:ABC transporter ATP-binding protein [Dehalococcoidia bacterium]|nr:ABC transporter ATP-binding protein [Dehalococcoidia bacterium]